MRRISSILLASTFSLSGLAVLAQTAAPAQAATPGTRVSLIGDKPLTGLMNAPKSTRDIIQLTYPMNIDGTACRGSVRSSCVDAPPAAGLPSSAYDVVKTNSGQLGEMVVIMTGYSDLIASPSSNPPDMTPFNKDFTTLMTELNNQPTVQKVLALNLRTSDARIPALQINKYNAINARMAVYDADNATYPKLFVGDWNTISATLNCGGTDDGCFPNDPIVPGANTGASAFASYLMTQLTALAASPGPGTPPAVGNRCLPSNGTGFAPYSFQPLEPGYPPVPPPAQKPDPGEFTSIAPVRVFDSRATRPVAANQLLRIQVVNDAWNVPPSAVAVALNVTAVSPCAAGFLTVLPCAPSGVPEVSNVNFAAFTNVPNAVTVRTGTLGRVCIFGSVQTDVIVDVNGHYSDVGSFHASPTPIRVTDTRTGTIYDPGTGAIPAGGIRPITLPVPDGTTGVALNVTALVPAAAGFMTVFPGPCGAGNKPEVSNLNFTAFQVVPNYVAVKVPPSKQICVFSSVTSNLLVDLNGTFGPSGSTLKALPPERVLDTRGGAKVQPFVPYTVNVRTLATPDLPANTEGVLLNATVVGPSTAGYLTLYPCGTTPPDVSNLNYVAFDVRPNLADAKLNASGQVCLLSSATTDVLLDLTGYYSV